MRCDECRFFHLYFHTDTEGECRRSAPRAIAENNIGRWPTIDRDKWCGEFEYTPEIYAAKITRQLED